MSNGELVIVSRELYWDEDNSFVQRAVMIAGLLGSDCRYWPLIADIIYRIRFVHTGLANLLLM